MSVSGTLSNALSGLNAAARAAEIVSSNISNALTEGYGRRDLQLSARTVGPTGAGVKIDGVNRNVDQGLLTDRRIVQSKVGYSSTVSSFFAAIESGIGTPDQPASLAAKLSKLEASLINASSMPDAESRLYSVLDSAKSLAGQINQVSNEIQSQRMDADQLIGHQVAEVNDALAKVAELNHGILMASGSGRDPSALMDQRQQVVDQISSTIPLREVDRGNGQIALFTPGGAILLDGTPAALAFQSTGVITSDMTFASGALSGLRINGVPVDTNKVNGPIGGGSLSALLAVRDTLAPAAQVQIDAVARDLVERFQSPAVDPTLASGQAGLFTDGGNAFDPLFETGLAGRLKINAAVDPSLGGEIWRIRDGLGASLPGEAGNATRFLALADALTSQRVPSSGGFIGSARSASGLSTDLLSLIAHKRRSADADQSFVAAQLDTLRTLELQNGVDSDFEIQQLLLIERAYAANAKMIQTVDDMIQTLLGL
ncbi:flagellar hook-associated protein FlgK [Pseudogemmobacter sp. W21_MBD1_M6]|uniref:flagellar hook-associated protein FlgK n=1 Tax=Pseudogemmobacter sp. W21_MBD1_M6 TaxID=3240271 RepID=UPI003F9AD464